MIDVNKIVTLETNEKFLIISDIKIKNERFLMGVRVNEGKYENDFRIFTENIKNNERYLEELVDQDLIRLIVDTYVIENSN